MRPPREQTARRTKRKRPRCHTAAAAWGDALRQVGLRFIPRHTLGADAIPDVLNQVAFWVVRRNSDRPTGNSQFTPIAVLIRPDQDCIIGMPNMQQWVPCPELLRKLTGQVRGDELKYADQQKSQVARFVRQVLYGLRNQPTLVLTYAQNARQSWDWQKNGQIVSDKIQLADLPIQDLALYGRKLRMARVRDGERAEATQWWAPASDEIAGFSVGLWEVGEDPQGDRVFFSTSDKASTHTDKQRDDTKLISGTSGRASARPSTTCSPGPPTTARRPDRCLPHHRVRRPSSQQADY